MILIHMESFHRLFESTLDLELISKKSVTHDRGSQRNGTGCGCLETLTNVKK
jgi:hypothetical protein